MIPKPKVMSHVGGWWGGHRSYSINLLKKIIYLFLERGEGKEKEKERNINEREKH